MPYFKIKLNRPNWCKHCKINIYNPLAKAGKLYCSICRKEIKQIANASPKVYNESVILKD